MWDLIVSVPDHCLSFYFLLNEILKIWFRLYIYIYIYIFFFFWVGPPFTKMHRALIAQECLQYNFVYAFESSFTNKKSLKV